MPKIIRAIWNGKDKEDIFEKLEDLGITDIEISEMPEKRKKTIAGV